MCNRAVLHAKRCAIDKITNFRQRRIESKWNNSNNIERFDIEIPSTDKN